VKPRIRYSRALEAWVVQESARALGVPATFVRHNWREAVVVVEDYYDRLKKAGT